MINMMIISRNFTTDDTKVMLAAEEWCTGAAVFTDVLDPEVLEHVERDVETFIRAFDEGYEPPSSPGSLTSGEGTLEPLPWSVFFRTVPVATKPLLCKMVPSSQRYHQIPLLLYGKRQEHSGCLSSARATPGMA